MRRSITSRIAVAGVAALALGLGACGSDTGTPEPTAGETTQSEETEGEEPAAPGEAINIEYLHRLPDGEGMVPVSEIVARWNTENPNIQVKATKFDGAAQEMIVKLETDIKAGAGVCLAQLGYGEVPEMFVKGLT